MIQEALNTTVKEVEVLYWIVEDSLIDGKKGKALIALDFLLYIAKYKSELIKHGLRKPQVERLKQISFEINEQTSTRIVHPVNVSCATNRRNLPFQKEAELRDYLAINKHIICDALKDNIRIYGKEVLTDDGYKCDIVAENKKTLYAIELKITQSTHSVCSQIDKYCFYFYRQMRYDRFKNIQGVVVSNGFDSFSINELRRRGHFIFEVIPTDASVELRRI